MSMGKILIFIGIIISIGMIIWMKTIHELNEKVESNIGRYQRLEQYIIKGNPAYIRYLGNTINELKHMTCYIVFLSENESGYIIVKFLNNTTIPYRNKEDFFADWRLLRDDA